MNIKIRFIPLAFLGVLILSIFVVHPVLPAEGTLRFYDIYYDGDIKWAKHSGRIGIEIDDPDLDPIVKMEGASAEPHTLSNQSTFYLVNIPVMDRNQDGFINARDITVQDENGNEVIVDRASSDGRVDLIYPYTGTVLVSYWGKVIESVDINIKSLADTDREQSGQWWNLSDRDRHQFPIVKPQLQPSNLESG